MNTNLIGSQIPSKLFTYSALTNEFTADMSEIMHGSGNPLSQLYSDAADQGFVMISHRTGVAVPFNLHDIQKDADGDVKYWEFHPSYAAIHQNRLLAGATVIIFND